MAKYSLVNPGPRAGAGAGAVAVAPGWLSGLSADFQRTGAAPWPVGVPAASVLDRLAQLPPEPLRQAARGWGAIYQRLAYGAVSAAERAQLSQLDLPAQAGWVRPTGEALKGSALEEELGVTGAHLVDLADRDPLLRSIAQYAGQAKDGAMDLRAANAALGWFVVSLVLDGLRREVARLPAEEGRQLLGRFAPMMVLLLQAQAEREDRRLQLKARRRSAEAEAQAAELSAQRAEALRAYHAGEEVPRSVLLDLALSAPPWDDEDEDEGEEAAKTARPALKAARRTRRKTTRK